MCAGIQCPHAMRNCLKKLWLLPAKLIASIPILLSERRFAGNGTIVLGNNQENVAYPSGLCAERTALFYASAAYPDVPVKALAITACFKGRPRKEVVSPCGACRQVMAEVIRRYGRDFDVLMIGEEETVVIKASSLLPFSFEYIG